ncbi:hypothetical protein IEQ34_014944 [Dendrobium chrysotoxum]|uniref:AP2/ERF domain-containing protein n=1 Tax=Dendrobium chrysotoxum TaxID=161865 RepID=A0AAV7GNC1_DENCH|nr:hypothetical protein IEQ34_014944 [Dendrobium chrysotoxum]
MADSNLPSQVKIPTSKTPRIIPTFHYHGILSKKGKWTSEIYSWRDSEIIYIGTYSTPQMAAIAYDVAALAFNGDKAVLNFPDAVRSHPVPKSNSIVDIQAAASLAAAQFGARLGAVDASEVQIPATNTQPSAPPPDYRGIYFKSGKWFAQVYTGGNPKTIYIGTYSTAEMAAIAYDVAMLTIRGDNAVFNFPDIIRSHPVPKSNSIADIRAAAAEAAAQFGASLETMDTFEVPPQEIASVAQFDARSDTVVTSDVPPQDIAAVAQFGARPDTVVTSDMPPQEIASVAQFDARPDTVVTSDVPPQEIAAVAQFGARPDTVVTSDMPTQEIDSNLPSQVEIPLSKTPCIIPTLHYHGILSKKSKWTSEIYSWRDSKIIYLGVYSTPEIAAIAYDVASLAFNGDKATFNFPDAIRSHPVPKSNSIVDIQAAAALAAEQFGTRPKTMDASEVPPQEIGEYMDEEELFNMPQILIEMAEGLMVSPPRFDPPKSDWPLEVLEDNNLWNFVE